MNKLNRKEIEKLESGQVIRKRFLNIDTPDCPICKSDRNVRKVKTIIEKRCTSNYFCSRCLIEFNIKVEIYPYENEFIKENTGVIRF